MLPLEVIKKFYPNCSEDEQKRYKKLLIYWLVQLCKNFMGQNGWEVLRKLSKISNNELLASSIPVMAQGYKSRFRQNLAIF